VCLTDDFSVVDHYGTDRHFAYLSRCRGLRQRQIHETSIINHTVHSKNNPFSGQATRLSRGEGMSNQVTPERIRPLS